MTEIEPLRIALYEPQIPPNTGNIMRLCSNTGSNLHLIKPLGFSLDDNSVARAGTRYWKYVNISQYEDWNDFTNTRKPPKEDLFLFEEIGQTSFYDAPYTKNSYLIFGSESTGLPQDILEETPDRIFALPMKNSKVKSLNLSNAATAAVYQALKLHW